MTFCLHNNEQKKLTSRLNKIEGQVRGIHKMIEDDRNCTEILNQIASCQAALKGVWLEVVRGHLQNCVKNGIKNGRDFETLTDELIYHLTKIK